MSEIQSILPENIILNIQENSGQIAVGNYIIQIGSIHGGVINIALPEQKPQVHPLALADPAFLPSPPALLLDRLAETETALDHIHRKQSVEIYGLSGIGKTTLLEYLAHQLPARLFPSGIVYLSGRRKLKEDLLQELFECFHEAESHLNLVLKPSHLQIQRGLRDKKALIILDDANLGRDELRELQLVLPGCTLLFASTERHWWRRNEGQALPLPGLPLENGLELLQYELERALTEEEQLAARVLWAALAGHPAHLIQAAALVREASYALSEIAYQSQQANPEKAIANLALAELPEPEKQVVQFLAALEGASLPAEHLNTLTGLADTAPLIAQLRRRGLVHAHSPRYSLTPNLGQLLLQNMDLTAPANRALAHFTLWTETYRSQPARLLEETEPILQLLEWAIRTGHWSEALGLARAAEAAFALGKRWATWEQLLQIGLQAARRLNNRAAEAWALHQLGSRALCLGETRLARTWLSQALKLREGLGDYIGATVTRHNLELLGPPPTSGSNPPPETTPPASSGTTGWSEIVLFSIVVVGLAMLLPFLILAWKGRDESAGPEPAPSSSVAVAFATFTPTALEPVSLPSATSTILPDATPLPPSPIPLSTSTVPPSRSLTLPSLPDTTLPPSPTSTTIPLLAATLPPTPLPEATSPPVPTATATATASATATETATTTLTPTIPASPRITSIEPGSGEAEQELILTVRGENFASQSDKFQVMLRAGDLTFPLLLGQMRTDILFEALVPPIIPAGRYDLQVINPDNLATSKEGAFEVLVPTATVTPEPTLGCAGFETLPPRLYKVYETLSEAGIGMTVQPFFPPGRDGTDQGLAVVEPYGDKGPLGQRLRLQSAALGLKFDPPRQGLALVYGHQGGPLSLEINGETAQFSDFGQVDGKTVGQVTVGVSEEAGTTGQLHFKGGIGSLSIGGQELWLDHLCPP